MRSVITTRLVDGTKAHNDDDDARVEGVRPPREGKGLASHVDKQPSPANLEFILLRNMCLVAWPNLEPATLSLARAQSVSHLTSAR